MFDLRNTNLAYAGPFFYFKITWPIEFTIIPESDFIYYLLAGKRETSDVISYSDRKILRIWAVDDEGLN